MRAESTPFALPRLDCDYHVNAALSFKFGAIAATTVSAIACLLYTWLGAG